MRVGTRCVWMQQRDRQRRHAKHATKRTNNPNCKQATRQVHTSNAHGKRQAVLDPPTPRPRCRRGARPGGGISRKAHVNACTRTSLPRNAALQELPHANYHVPTVTQVIPTWNIYYSNLLYTIIQYYIFLCMIFYPILSIIL